MVGVFEKGCGVGGGGLVRGSGWEGGWWRRCYRKEERKCSSGRSEVQILIIIIIVTDISRVPAWMSPRRLQNTKQTNNNNKHGGFKRWGNGCARNLLTQYWVNLTVFAEER